MSEKNNIENFFQNKFKDLEIAPPEMVWKGIEEKLTLNKIQKRVIPLWIRVSGAVAIFLIGITIASNYINKNESQESVVNSKYNVDKKIENKLNDNEKFENAKSVTSENSTNKENITLQNTDKNLVTNKNDIKNPNSDFNTIKNNELQSEKNSLVLDKTNKNLVVNEESKAEKKKKTNEVSKFDKNDLTFEKKNQSSVVNRNLKSENNNLTFDQNRNKVLNNNSSASNKSYSNRKTTLLSNSSSTAKNQLSNNKRLYYKKSKSSSFDTLAKKDRIIATQIEKTDLDSKNISQNITDTEKNNKNFDPSVIQQPNIISKINNSNSEIVATEIKKDTAKIVSNLPNPLEELLTKKDKKSSSKVAKVNRWQIFPNVAPVYFGSASNGSPIDDIFTKNSKNYKPNLSYGLAVNYSLNKRFSVQTGVNKVTLDYNTNGIVFYADIRESNIKTVNSKNEAAKMRVENKQANSDEPFSSKINEGYLNQKIGYIEIPVEVNYKLIDKKFGINLNAGVSTLVLNENSVSVVSDTNFKMILGEANNLNKFHLSSNIGIGFNYKFLKSFQINLEPKLKYQINTFNSNDGNFRPYFIGIYSGISYHF